MGVLEEGLDQVGREVMKTGSVLWEQIQRLLESVHCLMLGRWVSDSGDSKLAKAEVKAAAGEQPVALGPSGHWDNNASDDVPFAHCPCFRPQCIQQFQSPVPEPAPTAPPEPPDLQDGVAASSCKNTATFSEVPV